MAKKLILENLMKLAQGIGANPSKFMGTKTNISFLGKGPTSNILFQGPVRIKNYLRNRGSEETVLGEINDAMGFATAGKLNPIQLEILNDNLIKIATLIRPSALPPAPVLPSASITQFPKPGSGIAGLSRKHYTQEDIKLAKDYSKKVEEGTDSLAKQFGYGKYKSQLPEPGPEDLAAFSKALDQKTGMSRAIARNLLLKDTRLKMEPKDLFMLKEGKGEPLDMMKKYYGESMLKYDDFLNSVNIEAASPSEFAEIILKNIKLVPQFASGGLARILEI